MPPFAPYLSRRANRINLYKIQRLRKFSRDRLSLLVASCFYFFFSHTPRLFFFCVFLSDYPGWLFVLLVYILFFRCCFSEDLILDRIKPSAVPIDWNVTFVFPKDLSPTRRQTERWRPQTYVRSCTKQPSLEYSDILQLVIKLVTSSTPQLD